MSNKPIVIASVLALALGGVLTAQEKAGAPAQEKPDAGQQKAGAPPTHTGRLMVPLKVQVVLSRYQGDKKISSLPFTLSVNAVGLDVGGNNVTNVRMGGEVPVPAGIMPADEKGGSTSYQYKAIGTNIDCFGNVLEDGRFKLTMIIEDSSVYGDELRTASTEIRPTAKLPAFRSFKTQQILLLRDGQSLQYMTATDKISGEVVKVDVTINVVK